MSRPPPFGRLICSWYSNNLMDNEVSNRIHGQMYTTLPHTHIHTCMHAHTHMHTHTHTHVHTHTHTHMCVHVHTHTHTHTHTQTHTHSLDIHRNAWPWMVSSRQESAAQSTHCSHPVCSYREGIATPTLNSNPLSLHTPHPLALPVWYPL